MAAYAVVASFKTYYSEFLHYYDDALPLEARSMFEDAKKEFKWLHDFVERMDSRRRQRMTAWLQRIPDALQQFRQKINDAQVVGEIVEFTRIILETLKKLKEELHEYEEEEEEEAAAISSSKMIGFRDERSKLKEALVHPRTFYKRIFLVHGMAGIGKTMLAREIYEDLDISEWFECRVWLTQKDVNEWTEEQIAEAILAQVDPQMVMGGDREEIAQKWEECMEHKRCLIVVDDVWDHYMCLDNMCKFLGDHEDSRLLLTSRIFSPDNRDDYWLFKMQLLNKEESWDLLREKVFLGGTCPPQLEDSGKKIAEKCDGLPLTIVTVADLLSKEEESVWTEVAEKRKHRIFTAAYDQISEVLYPSYKNLDDEFKLCFLYMGVFPLKYKIHRSKLINLWSVEKIFDQFEEGLSPNVTFLNIITCLEHCSLIMVFQRYGSYSLMFNKFADNVPLQTVRTCGLHSSWSYFCQKEARKINFFHVLDCPDDASEESIKGQSRLSIHNNVLFAFKDVINSIEKNCASTAESLLCFGPYHHYMVPLCFGLKFLQRLDALNIRFYDFPLEVLQLAKLLYLALTCNKQLPSSISKLEKLQYLIVHPHLSIIKSGGAPIYMPMEIWDLEELKHLEVLGSDLPHPAGDKSLGMLSTLLDVSTASCTVLDKLPNLEKLRIRIVSTPEAPDPLCCFSKLMNIRSMTCVVVNPVFKFDVVPLFPVLSNRLVKLRLSGLGYPWEKIREISSLLYLRVLELQCNAFQGQVWELEEWEFTDLVVLLIEDLDLVKLEGREGSFHALRHLSIKHCYKLEKIQLQHLNWTTMVEVVDSNPLAVTSLKKIMLREENAPDDFSVHCSWKSA